MMKFSLGACAHPWLLSSVEVVEVLASISLVSCTNETLYSENSGPYSVVTTIEKNVWPQVNGEVVFSQDDEPLKSKADDTPTYMFQIYLFDSNGKVITNNGSYMSYLTNNVAFNDEISTTGIYTFFGVTNVLSGEYPSCKTSSNFTTDQTFTIAKTQTPADICLGKKQLTVTAGTQSYNATINVDHIMSKLALTVHKVPTDVTSMQITLTKQANVFNFNGVFTGDTLSQTLTLTKAATANTDGSYEWTSPATVVYPCATGTTSMPMTISFTTTSVTTAKEVPATSSVCCLSGKPRSLSTTWNEKFLTSTNIVVNEWSATEEGTFDWP